MSIQFSKIEFIDENNVYKNISNSSLLTLYHKAKGIAFFTQPAQTITTINIYGCFGRVFDHSISTKYCNLSELTNYPPRPAFWRLDNPSVLYAGEHDSLVGNVPQQLGYSSGDEMWQDIAGTNRFLPGLAVIDLLDDYLDIDIYSRWQFYNADDNARQTDRTWVQGEILGSNDMKKWWRLDYFDDLNIVNTNYALAYTGNLVPTKGDMFSDLDLCDRWTDWP